MYSLVQYILVLLTCTTQSYTPLLNCYRNFTVPTYKNLHDLAWLSRFLYFWVLKWQLSARRFLIHIFVLTSVYCILWVVWCTSFRVPSLKQMKESSSGKTPFKFITSDLYELFMKTVFHLWNRPCSFYAYFTHFSPCDITLNKCLFQMSLSTGICLHNFWKGERKILGSLYFSRKLRTYPSPKPTFCPKRELNVNVGLGKG